ncbi:MAG: GIY-YIG nuclease family protein [Candidatus Thorarchaeota archaeon]
MKEIIQSVPELPGVYFFLNNNGKILYIGKAINLKKRIVSHFRNGKDREFITVPRDIEITSTLIPTVWQVKLKQLNDMERVIYNKEKKKKSRIMSETRQIKYVITQDDDEALTLEGCLISAIRPELNRQVWKYPFIEITLGEEVPRILTCYQTLLPDSYIFGPFNVASDIDLAMDGFLSVIPICNALLEISPGGRYPLSCIRHHTNRCIAPCKNVSFSKEEYKKHVQEFISELENNGRNVIQVLNNMMMKETEKENFEGAAIIRDRIQAIERLFTAKAMPTLLKKYYQEIKEIIGEKFNYQGIIDKILENNAI